MQQQQHLASEYTLRLEFTDQDGVARHAASLMRVAMQGGLDMGVGATQFYAQLPAALERHALTACCDLDANDCTHACVPSRGTVSCFLVRQDRVVLTVQAQYVLPAPIEQHGFTSLCSLPAYASIVEEQYDATPQGEEGFMPLLTGADAVVRHYVNARLNPLTCLRIRLSRIRECPHQDHALRIATPALVDSIDAATIADSGGAALAPATTLAPPVHFIHSASSLVYAPLDVTLVLQAQLLEFALGALPR